MSMTSYFTFNIMHFENLHPCEELSMKSKVEQENRGHRVSNVLGQVYRFYSFEALETERLWKPARFKLSLFHMDE